MIPDFQSLMLPFLKYIGDNQEHSKKEVVEALANELELTEDEKNEMLPSRNQPVFYNRVTWAIAHFKAAKILENTRRGYVKITPLGNEILNQNLPKLDLKFLKQLPTYIEAMNAWKNKASNEDVSEIEEVQEQTPEELLEYGYRNIRQSLKTELLSKLKSVHPSFFERIVVELLVKMGYGGSIQDAGRAIGKSGDEGIDGIIKEDKLGLDVIYVQAKRWEGVVGRPELQKFVGALAGQGAKKGIFITTSYFTKDAVEYTPKNETKIVLIDGEKLAQYMVDYNLGVSLQSTYEIKKIDSDYFEED
ncbi:MAG TPA: restriction endonuclease [Chitinophagaceae bacterium]|nr:restriction endonuclease [Chitinophagaceae bacterium]